MGLSSVPRPLSWLPGGCGSPGAWVRCLVGPTVSGILLESDVWQMPSQGCRVKWNVGQSVECQHQGLCVLVSSCRCPRLPRQGPQPRELVYSSGDQKSEGTQSHCAAIRVWMGLVPSGGSGRQSTSGLSPLLEPCPLSLLVGTPPPGLQQCGAGSSSSFRLSGSLLPPFIFKDPHDYIESNYLNPG